MKWREIRKMHPYLPLFKGDFYRIFPQCGWIQHGAFVRTMEVVPEDCVVIIKTINSKEELWQPVRKNCWRVFQILDGKINWQEMSYTRLITSDMQEPVEESVLESWFKKLLGCLKPRRL